MPAPMRIPSGINNAAKNSTLWNFGGLDPTRYHIYFNDFDTYVTGDWTLTTVEGGGGDASEALTDVDGGCLLITNDAGDDDSDFFQKIGESFLMASGKQAWFKCRFKVSDATQSDWVIGLQVTDTTPLDATDGIYFQKDDGDALIDFYCRKDATTGSNSVAGIATNVDDTFVVLGWHYDGKGFVSYYVNDVKIGTISASSTYLPDTELTVSFGIQNGTNAAKTMTLDYIFAAKER